jgi:hypothetical protein
MRHGSRLFRIAPSRDLPVSRTKCQGCLDNAGLRRPRGSLLPLIMGRVPLRRCDALRGADALRVSRLTKIEHIHINDPSDPAVTGPARIGRKHWSIFRKKPALADGSGRRPAR